MTWPRSHSYQVTRLSAVWFQSPHSLTTASEGLPQGYLWDKAATIPPLPAHPFLLPQKHPLQQGRRAGSGAQTLSKHTSPGSKPPLLARPLVAEKQKRTQKPSWSPAAVTHLHLLNGVDQCTKRPLLHQLLSHHPGPDHCRERQHRDRQEVREA